MKTPVLLGKYMKFLSLFLFHYINIYLSPIVSVIYRKGFFVINFLGCRLIAPKSSHIFENQPLIVPGILAKMNKFSEICGDHPTNTLKRRGNVRFHVISMWNTRGVFLG